MVQCAYALCQVSREIGLYLNGNCNHFVYCFEVKNISIRLCPLWRGAFLGAVEEGRCVTPANDGKSNDYGMSMLLYDQ